MWTSLRTAVSGMMAQQRALDVAADNLSKLQVPGSKSQRASFVETAPELSYLAVPDGEGNVIVDAREVGTGVRATASLHNLSRGAFQDTGRPLDVAVDGDGFLEVLLPNGQTAYSRGGALRIDSAGQLTTASGALLSPSITVPPDTGAVEIRKDGSVIAVSQAGVPQTLGQLRLVRFQNPEGLELVGESLLAPTVASGAPIESVAGEPGVGTVVSGVLEASNVDPAEEYLRVIQAQRAYELNVRALKTVDEMLQDAHNLRLQ